MRNVLCIILSYLLLTYSNSKFLRFLQTQSSKNSYDYSNYNSQSTNENLSSKILESTTKDESVIYVTNSGISITNSNLTKTSGDSSNIKNSEFYGVNAVVLVQGGELTITGGTIQTSAKGANAVCATNKGNVTISKAKITSTASRSARGLHSTFGGSITASNVEIRTSGGSAAALATDKGEGKVICSECSLSTEGAGSPLIYSTGEISVSKTKGIATGAQMVVVEGKNTANVLENSELKCNGIGNRKNIDACGVMLYQSFSGDVATGKSIFNCKNSQMEILSSSSVYNSAPMFLITNTDSVINLENCNFSFGSDIFLTVKGTSAWGNLGSNGGVVTLNLKNQIIEGNFIVDENSGLTINLINSQIKGTFNNDNKAAHLTITLDKDSSIILTGNSYYTSITNEDSTGKNIEYGNNYNFTKSDEKEINRSSENQSSNPPKGSVNPPKGSGNPPKGSGNPPKGSGNPPNQSGNPPKGSGNPPNQSGNPPKGSGNPPNQSGNPPKGSGNPPNQSGNTPNQSGNPPNQSGNPTNGNETPQNGIETGSLGEARNSNNNEAIEDEDEDEAFIAKYFSSNQKFINYSYLVFIFILL